MTSNQSSKAFGRLKLAVKNPLATSNILIYIRKCQGLVEESRGTGRTECCCRAAETHRAREMQFREKLIT
jgi:hypothetical protein